MPRPPRLRILEPSCGRGAILRELRAAGVPSSCLLGVDLDPAAVAACRADGFNAAEADFLRLDPRPAFDLVLGNPPYSLAEDFVRASLPWLRPGGRTSLLLRLNFLEGQKRAAWLRSRVPDVAVIPRRPSFFADGPKAGKTDGTAYAWETFWPDPPRHAGRLEILDLADCAD